MAAQISDKFAGNGLATVVTDTKSEGILRPTTSNATGRYDRSGFAVPLHMKISSGMFIGTRLPEPAYLPPNWSAHVHPEGQIYFSRRGSPSVVTEAYLYQPETLDKVTHWIKKIEDIAAGKNFPISEHLELFIKIEGEGCAYYFVDHNTRAQSWMDDIDTDALGLPPVVSVSQLNLCLEELYWGHVEFFPMHMSLPSSALDSLLCYPIAHWLADQMTSRVSTFPYTKQECEAFVSLLKNSRDHLEDGNIVSTVARIWSLICRNRYLTQYGQEYSRLSRDQAVLYDPTTKHRWVSAIASRLSFKTSDRYLTKLDDLFVDHMVYIEEWKTMVTGCLQDWRRASQIAFFALILQAFVFALTPSISLAVTSASLFVASLLLSMLLVHRFDPLQGICVTDAMDYLESIQSPTFKFQFVALVYSLPQALNLWGILVFFMNCVYMLATQFGTKFAVWISVIALLGVLVFQWTTSPRFNHSLTRLAAKFSRSSDVFTSMV
ncbi:hypothetical protein B0H16DRAFT_1667299 [Mycena metata]|uniref:WW domain-containing protein n=1 Tax=Mycena metata TaxID=1033252 RepID=A0AAD7MF73_9AGAR|nr:hypothetical protein B0H16DRAFT_1667299 [Mycena metata]